MGGKIANVRGLTGLILSILILGILLKVIYIFNKVSLKMPMTIFTDID